MGVHYPDLPGELRIARVGRNVCQRQNVDSIASRIALAYAVGVLLAISPFDHVVVTGLHVIFGMLFESSIGLGTLLETILIVTAGNLVGGLGLVTVTHVAQAVGARESEG